MKRIDARAPALLCLGLLLAGALFRPASPAAAQEAPAAVAASTTEQEVAWRTNLARAQAGLPPLKLQANLNSAARSHAQDMSTNNFVSHTGSDGSSPWDRISRAGYSGWSALAENIGTWYDSPQAMVDAWMQSQGHRDNILRANLREIGVGYVDEPGDTFPSAQSPYRRYWTQTLGVRDSVYPVVIENERPTVTSRDVALYLYGSGWAQEMRLSNDGQNWSAWQGFRNRLTWTLSAGNGTKTVYVQLRQGATVKQAQDEVVVAATCTLPRDLNGDGVVDVQDVNAVVAAWRQRVGAGDGRDGNGDGAITTIDVMLVARAWGSRC